MSIFRKSLSILMICTVLSQVHAECQCKKKIVQEDEEEVLVVDHTQEEPKKS